LNQEGRYGQELAVEVKSAYKMLFGKLKCVKPLGRYKSRLWECELSQDMDDVPMSAVW